MGEMATLRAAEKDNRWIEKNFEKLQEEHPNRFVAVSRGRVLAEGKDSEKVVKQLERQGVEPATILVEFIPEKGLVLIL